MGRGRLLALTLLLLSTGCGEDGGRGPADAQERPARPPASAPPSPATAPVAPVELTFHPVLGAGDAAAATTAFDPTQEATVLDEQGQPLRIGPAALTNDDVAAADADLDDDLPATYVTVDFTAEGARQWQALTGQAACQPPGDAARRIAILVDGEVVSSPQVAEPVACDVGIEGGSTQITGDFTKQEALELARQIDAA
jgi:SecD/SecF fusion protein